MLVYSVADKNSFMALDGWLVEVRKYASPDVNMFVVGNKADLEADRQISYDDGQVRRLELASLGLCQED
jgi:GTPase SAR1 family protein